MFGIFRPFVFRRSVIRPFVIRPFVFRPFVIRPFVFRPLVIRPFVFRPPVFRPYVGESRKSLKTIFVLSACSKIIFVSSRVIRFMQFYFILPIAHLWWVLVRTCIVFVDALH